MLALVSLVLSGLSMGCGVVEEGNVGKSQNSAKILPH